jgi:hypothetical protein
MKENWISVKERLPKKEGIVKAKSEGVFTETAFTHKYGFDYDMQCEEYSHIVGVGTPDKITHWLDDSDESV